MPDCCPEGERLLAVADAANATYCATIDTVVYLAAESVTAVDRAARAVAVDACFAALGAYRAHLATHGGDA